MKDQNIDALVVPNGDPHSSEYMAPYWKKLSWISGFTGSAGTLVITQENAGLWTDGRYFIQGAKELKDNEFVLHKMGLKDNSTPLNWLKNNLNKGQTVSMTGDMWAHSDVKRYARQLATKNIDLKTDIDLIGEIWTEKRPPIPTEDVFIHDECYAGSSASDRIAAVRQKMVDQEVEWHLITTLDDVAWLCNLRGHDVPFNPVFLAHILIGKDAAYLYTGENKITHTIEEHLGAAGIEARPYDQLSADLTTVSGSILVNPNDCNENLYLNIPADLIEDGETISRGLKAIKNPVEQKHIERMMVKDGIALANAFFWLDQNVDSEKINEADFAEKIAHFRSQQDGYYGESFPAIVGYRSNGAINHYRPYAETALQIKREGILLCDSGGQYVDGTSDITRTIAMGAPKEEHKTNFTLVLKGHIALDSIHYPEGTTGSQLDVLARQHLWQAGLNYGHGTGHGVGFFMNVHEPPQGFAQGNSSRATTALAPGMFSSNEPGYYKDGEYGIRLENLILTQESSFPGFLCHHNVTLYPFDLNLIDKALLSPFEIDWINNYHIKVYSEISPYLSGDLKVWFEKKCGLLI